MKLPTILLLVVALSLIVSVDQTSAQCFEHSPLNFHVKTPVKCPTVTHSSTRRKRQDIPLPTSGASSGSSSAGSVVNQANSQDMFQITFTCGISNTVLCGKVKNAFVQAGQIITGTLLLKTPILVNATFMNFCTSMGDCGSPQGFLTLGGAAPARTLPMTDLDGKQRFYPQALIKQFGLKSHPQFGPFDISAMFNSVPNFWFQTDGPIGPDQSDFLFVVLHELVHGLGFTSSWDDYINQVPQALTPDLGEGAVGGKIQFEFAEYAFDQYMVVIPQNKNVTSFATQINQYATGVGANFQTIDDFASHFVTSPQYAVAKQMFQFGITAKSLGFKTKNTTNVQQSVILETSLNPYAQGSSISHVDYATYTNTSDFLMRFLEDRGVSLQDAILAGGNYSGGAIGPKLTAVLETMGYATQNNPNPIIPLQASGSSGVTTASGSSSASITTRYPSSSETKLCLFMGIAAISWFISGGNLLF